MAATSAALKLPTAGAKTETSLDKLGEMLAHSMALKRANKEAPTDKILAEIVGMVPEGIGKAKADAFLSEMGADRSTLPGFKPIRIVLGIGGVKYGEVVSFAERFVAENPAVDNDVTTITGRIGERILDAPDETFETAANAITLRTLTPNQRGSADATKGLNFLASARKHWAEVKDEEVLAKMDAFAGWLNTQL